MIGLAVIAVWAIVWAFLRSDPVEASPLVFTFNSPSFSGIGQKPTQLIPDEVYNPELTLEEIY